MVAVRKIRVAGIILLTLSPFMLLFQIFLLYVPNGINLLGFGTMTNEDFLFSYLLPSYVGLIAFGLSGGLLLFYGFVKK